MTTLSEPIVTSSPIAAPSWTWTWARRSHDRPTIAPSTTALRPMCVAASITDRVVRDPAVVADVRRPLDAVEVVDLDALSQPDVAPDADPLDVEAYALFERVDVGLAVLIEVPDVLPVAVHGEAV